MKSKQNFLSLLMIVITHLALTSSFASASESVGFLTFADEQNSQSEVLSNDFKSPFALLQMSAKAIEKQTLSLLNWASHNQPPEMPSEKYSRVKQFGRWINDPNDDSCYNTRAKVLIRDSETTPTMAEKNKCRVIKGEWVDPYTGQTEYESTTVQIDHLVPLKNAYLHGAWNWPYKLRCLYANFLGNNYHLITVDAHENMSKGDGGPESYMPPKEEFRCEYLKRWLTVKMIWNLFLSPDEAQSIVNEYYNLKCSLSEFQVSKDWIDQQRQLIEANKDLCKDPTSKTN